MIGRAALTVGSLTALSRVAGFARDLLIAASLGAGQVADAFFVSLKLANFLRRLFAEGAFSAAFIPVFVRLGEAEGRESAKRFAGEVLTVLGVLLLAVVLLGELAMPWIVRVLASGFEPGSERFALTVELSRATFPYLLFISLAAVLSGMLQARSRFGAAAFAPVLLNLVLIGVLLMAAREPTGHARWLAWGVSAAGVVQLLWVAVAAWRGDLLPSLAMPRLSGPVRRLLALLGPGIVGVGVVQINILVSSWFATHLPDGTVAQLFYADRLVQLPLGVVGIALGTALLPLLSGAARQAHESRRLLNRALETALLLALPAAMGLGLLARPIIAVLFERGAFGPEATTATAEMLAMLALGLPAYVLTKVLAPALFAREDTSTPVRVAAVALAVNAGLALLLTGPLGHVGLTLAMACASWSNALGLAWALRRRGMLEPDAQLKRRAAGITAATLVLGAVLALAQSPMGGAADAARLAFLIAAGGGSFLASAWLLGAFRPAELRGLLRGTRLTAAPGSGE